MRTKPSLTGKGWKLPEEQDRAFEIVERLALCRGIHLDEVSTFEKLADPMTLGDMEAAIERTERAVERGEKIGIIGDYDADGITGVAQLVRFFRRRNSEPHVILPHREKHGYGLKAEFIEALHARGVSLLITVDTGITAHEEIGYARLLGMDVIVCDHHALAEELPDAIIIHPSCNLQPKTCHLSGAGVAFTFLRALEKNRWEERDIDCALASVGTVADVVPLLGENRAIVALGLQALNSCKRDAPIFALARSVAAAHERITSSHIGFRMAPRINAAGRLADPHLALEALLHGGAALQALTTLNEDRQDASERMLRQAEEMIDTTQPLLALHSSNFHIGIIGLLAGKLTEKYGRPSVIGCPRDGHITCSLRSVPGYNIVQALQRCAAPLSSFGGHEFAAGCTVALGEWEAFIAALTEDAAAILGTETRVPTLTIDAMLETSDINMAFVRGLERLEPYGAGNREPLFLLRHQPLISGRCVGLNGKHLQCTVGGFKAVGFGLGHLLKDLPQEADLACKIQIDRWQGREQPQIMIEDIMVNCPARRGRIVA